MSTSRSASQNGKTTTLLKLFAASALLLSVALPFASAQQLPSGAGWNNVTLAEYRQHLAALDAIVADCAAQIKLKTPPAANKACDPVRVGHDDRVAWPGAAQPREVRYDWLRTVLANAGKKPGPAQPAVLGAHAPATNDKPPSESQLLDAAHQRLQTDAQQVQTPSAANPAGPNSSYTVQRKSLDAILAQRDYKGDTEVSAKDRFLEWLGNVIDRMLSALGALGAHAPWVARLLYGLLIGAACTILVLLIVRLERNARVRLIPDIETSPDAPSAREWQLWLKDAQKAAAAGQWREAIHSVYWASISRLESGRLWPADRARTPREYLALLRGNDPRKSTLAALTRGFERTWYGGREAAASDFSCAMALAQELGVKTE